MNIEYGLLYRIGIADVRGASDKEREMILGLFQEARIEIIELRARNQALEFDVARLLRDLGEQQK